MVNLFDVQPGSFDAAAFSNCLYQIPLKPAGHAAVNDLALDGLCNAATASIKSSPDSWSLTLLARCAYGVSVTYNPGVHIYMTPDCPPPLAWRKPSEAASELLDAIWHQFAHCPELASAWSPSGTHMNAYGMASVAHAGSAACTPAALEAWQASQTAWLHSAHASFKHARGDDVARHVCSSALVHACGSAATVNAEAVLASMAHVAQGSTHMNSSASASMLWGVASLRKAGILSDLSPSSFGDFVAAAAANVKGIRHTIRPLDFGLIAWSLKQLNVESIDPLVLPLLREQAASERLASRLGGKNAELASEALAPAEQQTGLGDTVAVRSVPYANSTSFPPHEGAPWPYAEKHVGTLGVVGE